MEQDITAGAGHRVKSFLKQLSFILIIISVFFLGLEFALALFGVRPLVSTEDPLVGFSGNIPLFVESVGPDGTVMMQTADNKLDLFNEQSFPKVKGDNSYRIFCMGGSTTVGRPYKDSTSFCGWLRVFLQSVEPERKWEVINAGGVSYASYRVARLMNELVQYQPDLFIIYSGQNEFLEQRSYGDLKKIPDWLIYSDSMLSRTRIYAAVKQVVDALNPDAAGRVAQQKTHLGSEVDEILKHTRGPTSYHRDDRLRQQIIEHYRLNLARMVHIARQADARVILVNPIANLKDMSPFKSEHRAGLTAEALAEWEALYAQGSDALRDGRYGEAVDAFGRALAIDDRYAEFHFRMGTAQFALRDFEAARVSFQRAIDEDVAPLRILSEMRAVVAAVADALDVPLVDYEQIIRQAYEREYSHTVFGKEYFLDHVHLTIKGYRLLAEQLLDRLVQLGVATPVIPLSEEKIAQLTRAVYSGIDKDEQRVALTKLGRVLDWAGKFEEAYNLFSINLKVFGPHPFTYSMMGKTAYRAGLDDLAIENLRHAVRLDPKVAWVQGLLGRLLKEQGETEAALQHLRAAVQLEPDNYTVQEELAILLASQGDFEAAAHHFHETMRLNPDDATTLLNFTAFLIKAGRDEEAMAWAEKMLKRDSYQAEAHNMMGILLARQDRFTQAIGHFNEALRIKPELSSAQENLARVKAQQAAQGDTAPTQ